MRSRTLCALLLLLLPSRAYSASFDCKLAHTPREKAVCEDSALSAQNSKLAAAYAELRAQLSPAASAAVQSDQRTWPTWLDKVCPPHGKVPRDDMKGCLAGEYSSRLDDFSKPEHLPDGHLLYTRDVFLTAPHPPSADDATEFDPGFGIGHFAYPQVDLPDAKEAAWNTAVETAALTNASTTTEGSHPRDFREAVDPHGEIDTTWSLLAMNKRMITIGLETMTMGYGAAHPSTVDSNLSWWIDKGRAVQAADVFLDASGWKEKLVQPTIAKLGADPDIKALLWKDKELPKGVRKGLADPQSWTLARSCLKVTFGQYQVAAYVAGMPSTCFTWQELKPHLNPDLHPETLPLLRHQD